MGAWREGGRSRFSHIQGPPNQLVAEGCSLLGSPKNLLLQGGCGDVNSELGAEDPAMQALLGGMGSGVRWRLCQGEGEGQPQSGADRAIWPLGGGIAVVVGLYSQKGGLPSLSLRLVGVGWGGRTQCQGTCLQWAFQPWSG